MAPPARAAVQAAGQRKDPVVSEKSICVDLQGIAAGPCAGDNVTFLMTKSLDLILFILPARKTTQLFVGKFTTWAYSGQVNLVVREPTTHV